MTADDTAPQGIIELIRAVSDLQQRAALAYKPVVDDILRAGSRDTRHIENTLDHLLDFCGFEPVLDLYKQLCRHYWNIDPEATAYYINSYREYWDSDEQGGHP